MTLRQFAIIFITLNCFGCYPIANKLYNPNKKVELYKSSTSDLDYFTIYKITHANCGCATIYAEQYRNKKLVYSVSYACPTGLMPYRQIIQYDTYNNIVSKNCYRATGIESYDTPLTDEDRRINVLLDSLALKEKEVNPEYKLCLKTIAGYNKIDCVY